MISLIPMQFCNKIAVNIKKVAKINSVIGSRFKLNSVSAGLFVDVAD